MFFVEDLRDRINGMILIGLFRYEVWRFFDFKIRGLDYIRE